MINSKLFPTCQALPEKYLPRRAIWSFHQVKGTAETGTEPVAVDWATRTIYPLAPQAVLYQR
ncbi:MAG: hypothetical protein QOF72_2082 [Blastocatellia bacterium]|jgi:hypothetical protein|nr:hypothetical protein [Blastocatellia bacterium]